MSFAALAWASKVHAGSAAEKLILLAYADRHNEETGCAYPSLTWLCEFSSLNRKTVIAAVARLEAAGLLTDSGQRVGETKQIKVYRVAVKTVPISEPSQKRNRPKNGTVPKSAGKESQKRDTEPVTGTYTPDTSSEVSPPLFEIPVVEEEPPLTPDEVLEAWNVMAGRCGLPKAKMTPKRRRQAQARIRESTMDEMKEALAAIERSKFLRGQNDRSWRADFDFFLQPSSFVRLIEGSYDQAA